MRYRNVEGVRMTAQTDREHQNGNGNKIERAHVARGVGRVEPSTLQRKTQRKNTKRRHKTWFLRKPGFVETESCLQTKVETKDEKRDTDDEGGEGRGGVGSSLTRQKSTPRGKSRLRPKTK